jgi:hypothetical protein
MSEDPEYTEQEYNPGAVDIDLGLTINLRDYQSFKLNIGINEPYSGRPGDTRTDKVNEIIDYIQKVIDEKVTGLTIHNKKLANLIGEGLTDLANDGGRTTD